MSCVDDSTTIDLEIDSGTLTAELIVSPQPGNQAEVLGDGLFIGVSVPPGCVLPYAGSAVPSADWLICDGSAVNRSTYADLFAIITTLYGAGDGSTTFNLPDLRGRAPFGLGTHADVNALGDSDGEIVGGRSPKHRHTLTTDESVTNGDSHPKSTNGGGTDHTTLVSVGPAGTPLDGPGYLTLNFIIKT